jgi:hypothetical protein
MLLIAGSLLLFALLVLLIAGSLPDNRTRPEDFARQSFSHKDKKPGGCYVAFKTLPHLYGEEALKVVTKPFAHSYEKDYNLRRGKGNLYILVAHNLFITEKDLTAMLNFAAAGNQLFLAVSQPDSLLKRYLGFDVKRDFTDFKMPASVQHYVNPHLAPDTAFSRDSLYGGSFFSRVDTPNTTILGTNGRQPNFIRVRSGEGEVFVLLNPSSLTNYFLLKDRNIVSLEREMAYTYYDAVHVYWDEYYKYLNGPQADFSEWQVLMRYPSLRWALWLFAALLLLYVLFESKRRQRIIPDKPALANNSLEFVEALGQLYYQQHHNKNLAQKMILHWTEYIRSRFYLSTNYLNPAFMDALARKSGMPYATVKEIVDNIHHIQLSENVSDEYLQQFYKSMQHFYLNTK